MGLFDSIYLRKKCPYCGKISDMEFQTKDLDCVMDNFKKGDFVSKRFNFVDCTADCHSEECQARADKNGVVFQGCPSGFGSLFEAKVEIKKGKITGKIFDIVTHKEYTNKWLNNPKRKKKWIKKYKPRKKWVDYVSE